MKEPRRIDWDDWPQAWEDHKQNEHNLNHYPPRHASIGVLTRVLKSVPGVFDATVEQEQRLVRPMYGFPATFSETLVEADAAGIQIEKYPCIVVDLNLRPPGWVGSADWEHWGENLHWKDLVVFHRVALVLEDSVPAGVQWAIKQQEELMSENGRDPSFGELVKKMPAIEAGVMRLMEKLDHWTLRSMQVETDKQGNFKSQWDPGLAPVEAKPKHLENWTVLLLEFVVESHGAEEFTSLVRTVAKSSSKLGVAGSLTHKLEETVRTVSQENDDYKWAAAAYREIANQLLHLAEGYDGGSAQEKQLAELRGKLAIEDTTNVGALYHKRFTEMERAVYEKRPEVAADLLRGLEDD